MCCAKLKRFIDVYLPITVCNLKCSYCYITQQNLFNIPPQRLKYSPTQIGLALSKERLGGVCCFNICGGGETMLSPDFIDVVRAILEQGHFVMVVTNGTISKKIEELLSVFPEEFLERLGEFLAGLKNVKALDVLPYHDMAVPKYENMGLKYPLEGVPPLTHDEALKARNIIIQAIKMARGLKS